MPAPDSYAKNLAITQVKFIFNFHGRPRYFCSASEVKENNKWHWCIHVRKNCRKTPFDRTNLGNVKSLDLYSGTVGYNNSSPNCNWCRPWGEVWARFLCGNGGLFNAEVLSFLEMPQCSDLRIILGMFRFCIKGLDSTVSNYRHSYANYALYCMQTVSEMYCILYSA